MIASLISATTLIFTRSELPTFYTKDELTCAEWAVEANLALRMGPAEAINWIEKRSGQTGPKGTSQLALANVRACHLMRVLFVAKNPKEGLRAPNLGGLSCPPLYADRQSWPNYPMIEQSGVWFELDHRYILAGGPGEHCREYANYCLKMGNWRGGQIPVPTSTQATLALKKLFESDRWKSIAWSRQSSANSYDIDEQTIKTRLLSQTKY